MRRYLQTTDLAPKYMQEQTLRRLTGDLDEQRLSDAEKDAVSLVISHLTNNYEIEEEIALGRSIEPYNPQKEYRAGSYLYEGGKFLQAARTLTPSVRPDAATFWRLLHVSPFNEAETYEPGREYYRSKGEDIYRLVDAAGEVTRLDSLAWEKVETPAYSGEENYLAGDVVECDTGYYVCERNNGALSDNRVHPSYTKGFVEIDAQALPEGVEPEVYDRSRVYRRKDGFSGYVKLEGRLYHLPEENEPLVNPDSRQLIPEKYEQVSDPRNSNIVRAVGALTTYFLYQALVPDNIPTTTIREEEKVLDFLRDAARLKVNPLLRRKMSQTGSRANAGWVVVASEGDKRRWWF